MLNDVFTRKLAVKMRSDGIHPRNGASPCLWDGAWTSNLYRAASYLDVAKCLCRQFFGEGFGMFFRRGDNQRP